MTSEAQQLADAPTNIQPPPEPKPESYTVEFLVETPEGFHALFRGEGLAGKEMLPWMLATSKGLAAKGFLPVRRDMAVDVKVEAPAPAWSWCRTPARRIYGRPAATRAGVEVHRRGLRRMPVV
jgi:hypothetical protein